MMNAFDKLREALARQNEALDAALAQLESLTNTVDAASGTDTTTIVLNKYERDNLLALLHLIYRTPDGPSVLATGDWAGQIYWKLAERGFDPVEHNPNHSPSMQLEHLEWWSKKS